MTIIVSLTMKPFGPVTKPGAMTGPGIRLGIIAATAGTIPGTMVPMAGIPPGITVAMAGMIRGTHRGIHLGTPIGTVPGDMIPGTTMVLITPGMVVAVVACILLRRSVLVLSVATALPMGVVTECRRHVTPAV